MSDLPPVYIVSAVRTPLGSFQGLVIVLLPWANQSQTKLEILADLYQVFQQRNWALTLSKVSTQNCFNEVDDMLKFLC